MWEMYLLTRKWHLCLFCGRLGRRSWRLRRLQQLPYDWRRPVRLRRGYSNYDTAIASAVCRVAVRQLRLLPRCDALRLPRPRPRLLHGCLGEQRPLRLLLKPETPRPNGESENRQRPAPTGEPRVDPRTWNPFRRNVPLNFRRTVVQ